MVSYEPLLDPTPRYRYMSMVNKADQGMLWVFFVAIRLAYELELHRCNPRPLPSSETEAREVLDRERCWFQLICFDLTCEDPSFL
jgi:hypothetical protein